MFRPPGHAPGGFLLPRVTHFAGICADLTAK